MDPFICSFSPIVGPQPRILILGTMPSVASLRAEEYYAHPGNAFWKILSELRGIDCPIDYERKKQLVVEMNLALWDVCHTCIRPGSADSAIIREEPNDIRQLLYAHPSIRTILFNGKTAEKLFHRHLKSLKDIQTSTLPSTSPAYTLPYGKKLEIWKSVIERSF